MVPGHPGRRRRPSAAGWAPPPTIPSGGCSMAEIRVVAERPVGAPPDVVYRCIADYREHHPRFLPPAFTDFRVEQGGVGAGTVIAFDGTFGGRTRSFRMQVAEPQPGRVLTESDMNSSM